MDLLVYLTYWFGLVLVGFVAYYLYCWSKDNKLDEEEKENTASFDIDGLIKRDDDQRTPLN